MWGPIAKTLAAVVREPLLHFAVLGLVLLGLYRSVAPPSHSREIVVSDAVVQGLREDHRRRNGVAPSADEEAGFVQRYVDNEILYREALALGLDRGDVIVRRRLIQKMEFLAEQLSARREPSDADLATFLRDHAGNYARPSRLSFEHVFLRSGDSCHQRALDAQQALRAGGSADTLGDPFLRGRTFVLQSTAEIAGIFGDDFAAALAHLADDTWVGPLRSAYGEHVVRITERQAEHVANLDEVRDNVARAWKESQQEQAVKDELQRLRADYTVIRGAPAAPSATP